VDESTGQKKKIEETCTDESRERCVRIFRETMRLGLSKLWGEARRSQHLVATFLDPRFKVLTNWGINENEQQEGVKTMVREMTYLLCGEFVGAMVSHFSFECW